MSTITALQGKMTFAFNGVIKRTKEYLQKTHQQHQIQFLPDTYPQHQSQMSHIDIAARAKILKVHLEDTFARNIFSVKITRRKSSSVIRITHDSLEQDRIQDIALLYEDSDTCVTLEKFQ